MPFGPSRRQFIASTGAAIAASTCLPEMKLFGDTAIRQDDPLFEISLAEWSLHRSIRGGKLDNLDFPRVAKEEFGISGVEYVNQFFKDKAEDEKYLADLNQRCSDVGVESVLIMIDGEGALGDPNPAKQKKAVENHHKWVTAAKTLGCHSIRVNAKSGGTYEEQVKRAADGLRSLSEFAAKHDINVIVENHGGLSSNGQWLAQVIMKVNLDNCGTLPDFGNFRISRNKKEGDVWYDRYLGMAALMPFAKAVSAKSHDFDKDGNETKTDYLKVMQIVKDAGYRGWVGIEYEGSQLDEYEGIKATKKLLEKCRDQLSVV
ncbi:MAG: sugar phosphate isomerase/epimerase family protein [Planctomycetota bacterium]